jgi:uncharacterized protein (TIGR03067 family)
MRPASSRWLVIAFLATLAAARADDPAGAEAGALQGTWRFVAAESEEAGWAQPPESVKTWIWWIRDTDLSGPGPTPGFTEATLKFDPQASPGQLDIRYPGAAEEGPTLQGIYKLEPGRADPSRLYLVICLRGAAEAERGRPEKFQFSGGEGLSLLILEKVRSD